MDNGAQSVSGLKTVAQQLGKVLSRIIITVERYRGNVVILGSKVKIGDKEFETDSDIKPSVANLLTTEFNKDFSRVESRLRNVAGARVYRPVAYSPRKDPDTNEIIYKERKVSSDLIVAKEYIDEIFDKFDRIVVEDWNPLVDRFLNCWSDMIEAFRVRKPEVYEFIKDSIPKSLTDLRDEFVADRYELALGVDVNDLTVAAVQRGMGKYLESVRESVFRQAIDKLKDNVNYVTELLTKENGRVTRKTLENAMDAMAMFKSVATLMPADDVVSLINAAEMQIANTPVNEINKNIGAAGDKINELMQAISNKVNANEMLEMSNRRQRKIAI